MIIVVNETAIRAAIRKLTG